MSYTEGDRDRDPSSPAGRRDICGAKHRETDLDHYFKYPHSTTDRMLNQNNV